MYPQKGWAIQNKIKTCDSCDSKCFFLILFFFNSFRFVNEKKNKIKWLNAANGGLWCPFSSEASWSCQDLILTRVWCIVSAFSCCCCRWCICVCSPLRPPPLSEKASSIDRLPAAGAAAGRRHSIDLGTLQFVSEPPPTVNYPQNSADLEKRCI